MQKGISIVERLALMGILADCEEACSDYGITIAEAFCDVKSRTRSQPIVWARWTVFRVLEARGWSAKAIGDAVGMHHTSVADALRRTSGVSAAHLRRPRNKKSPQGGRSGGGAVTPAGEEELSMTPESGQSDSKDDGEDRL